ncbi:hypothetical protein GCM10028807_37550 [Spirosoma daeguense]
MFSLQKNYPQDYFKDQTYLSGVLTGLAAGLAIGFLFAPRSGKKLRKHISGVLGDQTKEAKKHWDKAKHETKQSVRDLKDNVGSALDKAEDKFSGYAHQAEKKAGHFADNVKDGVDKAKESARLS